MNKDDITVPLYRCAGLSDAIGAILDAGVDLPRRERQALRAIGETLVSELEKLINVVEAGHAFDKTGD